MSQPIFEFLSWFFCFAVWSFRNEAKYLKWISLIFSIKNAINPFYTGNPQIGILANIEDPDEMHYNAAFHLGIHSLKRLKQPSGTEIHHNLEISTSDPFKYTMGSPILIVTICMGKSIRIQRVKGLPKCAAFDNIFKFCPRFKKSKRLENFIIFKPYFSKNQELNFIICCGLNWYTEGSCLIKVTRGLKKSHSKNCCCKWFLQSLQNSL